MGTDPPPGRGQKKTAPGLFVERKIRIKNHFIDLEPASRPASAETSRKLIWPVALMLASGTGLGTDPTSGPDAAWEAIVSGGRLAADLRGSWALLSVARLHPLHLTYGALPHGVEHISAASP